MAKEGVDYVVAMGFAWQKEKFAKEQNLYFSSLPKLSQGKIIPFGTIPLDATDVDIWAKEIKDFGLAGIGEIAFYSTGMDEASFSFLEKLFLAARKYSLPVCLHVNEPVGHFYPGKYDPNLKKLYDLLVEFTDLKIILAHFGGGLLFYELMPEVNNQFKNFYYDTAATPFLYRDKIYKLALEIVGEERIIFGSDFPLLRFKKYLNSIKHEVPEINAQQKILGGNITRILKSFF